MSVRAAGFIPAEPKPLRDKPGGSYTQPRNPLIWGRWRKENMTANGTLALVAFLMASTLVLLVDALRSGRRNRLAARLDDLAGRAESEPEPDTVAQLARSALPKMGAPLVPEAADKRGRLQARLLHAGLYGRQAMVLLLGVKMLLMITPLLLGLAVGLLGLVPFYNGVLAGMVCGLVGMIGPSFWLDKRKAARQCSFRRALPDALDVLVICLEGGLSLAAGFRRVAGELRTAHPLLALELSIVEREMQLGRSTGEAVRQFADRTDLEEIRSLAALILQAERFGASLVKALRVHADTLRLKRLYHAEEMAQKAAIKILFPTLLCIFPGIFIVILGPAAIQLMDLAARFK
jgi:tight adherence protein C